MFEASDQQSTAQTDTVLVTGVAGRIIQVYSLVISTAAAMTVTVESGTGTRLFEFYSAANGGIALPYSGDSAYPYFQTVAGENLTYTTGAAGNTFVYVLYTLRAE